MIEYILTTKPYDDKKLVYDYDEHRYITLQNAVNDRLNVNLTEIYGSDAEANVFLNDISERFYNIIYSSVRAEEENSIRIKEYQMAKDHKYREYIYKIFISIIRASINSDIELVGDQQRVNFKTGARIDIKEFDDLPLDAQRLIRQTDLLFAGTYDMYISGENYRKDY